jgi:hypothetical protein
MSRFGNIDVASKDFKGSLLTVITLCLLSTGCGNYCVNGFWNPSGGIVSVNSTSCTLGNTNGNVRLHLSLSPVLASAPASPHVQHIFVSLRGIEAHPSALADADSPDWQELAPTLGLRPLQLDLMAPGSDSCALHLIGRTTVRADVYRQIRLRLVPDKPATNDPVPDQNACGDVGFNCIVSTDGGVRSIAVGGAPAEVHIASERIMNGFFTVLPDADSDLGIEFSGYSLQSLPASQAIRLIPVFTADVTSPCDSP